MGRVVSFFGRFCVRTKWMIPYEMEIKERIHYLLESSKQRQSRIDFENSLSRGFIKYLRCLFNGIAYCFWY